MSRKVVLSGFTAFDGASAVSNITSEKTVVNAYDSATYQIKFSAPNTGVFKVQIRNGKYRDDQAEEFWGDLYFGPSGLAITAETDVFITLAELTFNEVRLVWEPSAGAGTITAKLTMKSVGV